MMLVGCYNRQYNVGEARIGLFLVAGGVELITLLIIDVDPAFFHGWFQFKIYISLVYYFVKVIVYNMYYRNTMHKCSFRLITLSNRELIIVN